MLILKDYESRHDKEGNRIVEVTLHTDSLSGLPTSAADIEGLLETDILGEGSIALDVTSGSVAMFDGTQWRVWS